MTYREKVKLLRSEAVLLPASTVKLAQNKPLKTMCVFDIILNNRVLIKVLL